MSPVPRRWVLFLPPVVILVLGGVIPLCSTWAGEQGEPTHERLYLLGDFRSDGPLLRLVRADSGAQTCYRLDQGERVCGRNARHVWVEDALVEVSVGARGLPQVSLAGARLAEGAVIGSGADPSDPAAPRIPFRGYGIPYRAATVGHCGGGAGRVAWCLEVHDRLGRLAIARRGGAEAGDDLPLRSGKRYQLRKGDHLWLGLVPYAVDTTRVENEVRLVLTRVPRAMPDPDDSSWTGRGGDRRWLGRLWPVEGPDAADSVPSGFEVYPSRKRYFPGHLSRQRTNYESEDLLQRLVDGEWLCLRAGPGDPRVEWRPLEGPGCNRPRRGAPTRSQIRDYTLARSGLLAAQVGWLVSAANTQFTGSAYLDDPMELPFAFNWELARIAPDVLRGRGLSAVQPIPGALWGVRFGTTLRVARRPSSRITAPDVYLRGSTSTHMVELSSPGREPVTLHLVAPDPADPSRRAGSVCLGSGGGLRPPLAPSRHYPLGAVRVREDLQLEWQQAPSGAVCGGCRLDLSARADGASGIRAVRGAGCGALVPGVGELQHGDSLVWSGGTMVLRFLRRGGMAWVARTDPRSGRRYYAEEFYHDAGLAPLLGDPAGLSGVEAAVREFAAEAPDSLAARPLELTVDGDLQIAAARVVAEAAADAGIEAHPGEAAPITAVVLDAVTGEVLAAVNHFRTTSPGAGPVRLRPTAWELGAARAHPWENTAFLRRGAIGSTMKIVGAYALVNHGLPSATPGPMVTEAALVDGERRGYGMRLTRSGGAQHGRPVRFCEGAHALPLGDDAFTAGVFEERFAQSCNNFFVMTGFRHASVPFGSIRAPGRGTGHGPGALAMEASPPTLVQSASEPIADRIRQGLAADGTVTGAGGRSIYGLWFRLGFQPTPRRTTRREPADLFGFIEGGRRVQIPLYPSWFGPSPGLHTPVLRPGRDFTYPSVPSPGRLTEYTGSTGGVEESYDGAAEPVRTVLDDQIGMADVQYAQLLIGQGEVGVSSLALALMYAPAARTDGRAVYPCLFRAACSRAAAGPVVVRAGAASLASLDRALRGVVGVDGTAFRRWQRAGASALTGEWGGKTGTYVVEHSPLPSAVGGELRALVEHACGVRGAAAPPSAQGPLARYVGVRGSALVGNLAAAARGAAAGAWACEGGMAPLNPGGIHRYGRGPEPVRLDTLIDLVERRRRDASQQLDYHAFVLVSPPPQRGGAPPTPSGTPEGIVIAVLVDHEEDVSVRIGVELAALVERWTPAGRRARGRVAGGGP